GGKVGPLEDIPDRQHVVARNAPHLGAHSDRGGAIGPGGAGRIRDPRLGGFALDRDVDPAAVALELFQERAPYRNEALERRVSRGWGERGDGGNGGRRRKVERELFAQLGRGKRPGDDIVRGGADSRRPCDADASPVAHPEIRARFLRDAGRLEATPFERDRGSLRSNVWNRLPASTTSLTSSARCPSRIMRP